MSSTVNPRARGGASLSGELRASRDDRQQIRRMVSRPPAPKPAPAASGGAVGNSEAASSTYAADAYGVTFQSWAFTPHTYWPGAAPSLVASGADEFDPSEAGWYIACVKVNVFVSGTVPAYARIEVNGDSTSNTDATASDHRPFLDGGVRATVTVGPFYHPGPGVANHFLGCAVTWPGTPGATVGSADVSYLLARVG